MAGLRNSRKPRLWQIAAAVVLLSAARGVGGGWPTYRHDNQRSGVTSETLPLPLAMQWTYTPVHAPQPADPPSSPDGAFHAAIISNRVFFGSSADHKVYAVDAVTGDTLWTTIAGGAIRRVPTVTGNRVLVGADDGRVYCLDAATGTPHWVFDATPAPRRVVADGRIMSRWPIRGGVAAAEGIAYFAAGIFPVEGIFLYAVDIETGELVWCNSALGRGGYGTVVPSAHILLDANKLFLESRGRLPVIFDRRNGIVLPARRRPMAAGADPRYASRGTVLGDERLYSAGAGFVCQRADTGAIAAHDPDVKDARRVLVSGNRLFLLTGDSLEAHRLTPWLRRHRRASQRAADSSLTTPRRHRDSLLWRAPCRDACALILAGQTLVVGGHGRVSAYRAADGSADWSERITGNAQGLAVADRRLYVSSGDGTITCFARDTGQTGRLRGPTVTPSAAHERAADTPAAVSADTVLRLAGKPRGIALLLGAAANAGLAFDLATRSSLRVESLCGDADAAAALRTTLDRAGVYGTRTAVHTRSPQRLPLPPHAANVVVCDARHGVDADMPPPALLRLLRPHGGVALVRRTETGGMPGSDAWVTDLEAELAGRREFDTTVSVSADWVVIRRGAPPDTSPWTHRHGSPANTRAGANDDLRGPLGLLWINRLADAGTDTAGAASPSMFGPPLAAEGRLFIPGADDSITAVDTYNGTVIWRGGVRGLAQAAHRTDFGNVALGNGAFYAGVSNRCLRLDARTGHVYTHHAFPAGTPQRRWQRILATGERVLGVRRTVSITGRGTNDQIAAVHATEGGRLWTHSATDLVAATLCAARQDVYYVDRLVASDAVGPTNGYRAVCLDARGGDVHWERRLTDVAQSAIGSDAATPPIEAMESDGVLVLFARCDMQAAAGADEARPEMPAYAFTALDAETGSTLWTATRRSCSRPLLTAGRIVAEPRAYELRTGAPVMRPNPITAQSADWQFTRAAGHREPASGTGNMLLFGSARHNAYDLLSDHGSVPLTTGRRGGGHYAIAADGLALLTPAPTPARGARGDSTRGACVMAFCSSPGDPGSWGTFSAPGKTTPVRRLQLDFGAPGDRRGPDRRTWLAFPRHHALTDVPGAIDVPVSNAAPIATFRRDPRFLHVHDTDMPHLYASGIRGPAVLHVRLHDDPGATAQYSVRLHFAADGDIARGERIFNVRADGGGELENFDVVREAGGPGRTLIRAFRGLRPDTVLDIELEPVKGEPRLCALEIARDPVMPVTSDMVVSARENTVNPIALPAKFTDGTPMVVRTHVVTPPSHGTLTNRNGRHCDYIPHEKFIGLDRFEWQAVAGEQTSATAHVTMIVKRDREPPLLEWAASIGPNRIRLTFSEHMDRESVEKPLNYVISRGIYVTDARLLPSRKQVLLTTSDMVAGDTYTVTVHGLYDTALTPNRIADDAKAPFRFERRPASSD